MTSPGGNPVMARPGLTPRSPRTMLEPVLVTVAPASTAKLPTEPSAGAASKPALDERGESFGADEQAAAARKSVVKMGRESAWKTGRVIIGCDAEVHELGRARNAGKT